MSALSRTRPQSTVQTTTQTPSMGEGRRTEVPAGYHSPRRQNTWPRAKQVIVYVQSDDSIYLESREKVDKQKENSLKVLDLPRNPWKAKKDIYVPSDKNKHSGSSKTCPCCRYVGTVRFDHIDPNLRLKRAVGSVKKLYVFQNPLQETSGAL
ncbi:hypothetical protein AOQ84DRAFT_99233 [Glonium stellatum]|uniref:Uncharacterized protein n=1 Tax=Glonium stellatum TaxID=574774 RepID=A0A8E2EUV9_9PEZI|nr:hypothetical protein AOQ84DRAFT_99233 [Glonium stellatum]